jgi:CHAT domain-containing protein
MVFRFRTHGSFNVGNYSNLIDESRIPELTLYLMKYTTNLWKISSPQDLNKIVIRFASDDQDFFEYTFRSHKANFYQLLDRIKELFLIQEKIFSLVCQEDCNFTLSPEEVIIATSETVDINLFGIKLLFTNPFMNENQTLIPIALVNSLSNSSLESVQFLIDRAVRDNRSFDLALLYCCQGKILTNMNEAKLGLNSILDGIKLFEGIRSSIRNDRLGLGFGDGYLNFYDWAIDAAMQANEISQAFDYSEHGKSRSILDLLCQRTSYSSGKLQEKLTELQDLELSISLIDSFVYSDSSDINWLPSKMQTYYKKNFYDSKKRQIDTLSKIKKNIIQEIDEIDSNISSLIVFNPLSWNQDDNNSCITQTYNDLWTSQSIDCNEAIIVFHGVCGDSYKKERKWQKIICYCIFSAQQSIQLKHHVIDDSSCVSNLQKNCRNLLKEIYSVSSLRNLLNVSEVLMTPVLQNLPGNIDKLVIMGNDEFQFLPWSTTCVGENPISMELSWLIEKFSIRIAPSLSLLLILKNRENLRQKRNPSRFLISGVSLYPKLSDYLYWVGYEINSIAKLHNVNPIKDECLDYQFADEFQSSEIIHFSGHAEYEVNSSAYALDKTYLRLYQKRLSASAILDGALQSDTAKAMILSACLTSRGDLIGAGNEILGLERALFYAGLSALVTTLWSVEDFPSSLLMIKFHLIWKIHNNSLDHLSISLTLAQRWLRQATWHDLRQMESFDETLQKCIEAYSVLIEHAHAKNDINATASLEKSKLRYEQYNIDKNNDKKIPFQHPYYWAAFQVKGVG